MRSTMLAAYELKGDLYHSRLGLRGESVVSGLRM